MAIIYFSAILNQKMKLVTVNVMRHIDAATIAGTRSQPVPSIDLMESAGQAVADAIWTDHLSEIRDPRVAIFCGKGNNGGDGFVVARTLIEKSCHVRVFLLSPVGELSPDSRINYERFTACGGDVTVLSDISALPDILNAAVIVDAIFGTGFTGSAHGLAADVIAYINQQDAVTCSIDTPSGVATDTGEVTGPAVWADFTYSLALPKWGHYLSPGRERAGVVCIIPIGIPELVVESFGIKESLITPELVLSLLPSRKPDAHKGDLGRLYLLVGSTGLTGAGALAAHSAMRSGVGAATIGCAESLLPIYATKLDEVMTRPLPDVAKRGIVALRAKGQVLSAVAKADAVVVGPGLGSHRETSELVRRLILAIDKPFVLDADGINALESDSSALKHKRGNCVLTPHDGEFSRLVGAPAPLDREGRIHALREAARQFNCVIALKGSPTLVADVDGEVFVNPTGNAGMATAGSGDVLAGVIGSLLAQGLSHRDAALVGVYVHGLAGDFAAARLGQRAMIAGDITECLGEAFLALESSES